MADAGDDVSSVGDHIVCQYKDYIATFGLWLHRNPMEYAVPLVLLQLSVVTLTSLLIDGCLKPLGQLSIVAQIVGGILFGPSILGHDRIFGNRLFPTRSIVTLETAAAFGLMFFLFAIGVRSNPKSMINPGKQAMVLGVFSMFLTLFLTVSLSFMLKAHVAMDASLARALPFIAASQSLIAFPNISCLLVEFKMSSTSIGRTVMAAAMFCDFIGILIIVIFFGILQSRSDPLRSSMSIISAFLFIIGIVFLVGPLMDTLVKRMRTGKSLGENYVLWCLIGNLLIGSWSEMIGQHFVLGPLVYGLMVPDSSPLGLSIIAKLDYFVGKFLYSAFLTTSGLKTDIFTIELQSLWIVALVVIFSCVVKLGAVLVVSYFININFQDSVVIGLMLNARGVTELIVFNLWRDSTILSNQEFSLCVVATVAVTAVISPLIKLLHDPTKRYIPTKRRSIQHSKRDAELRIAVCIKDQDSVPSIINLLVASNATQDSPIAVLAILQTEIVGRATPMLVSHQSTQTLHRTSSKAKHIINALRQYEMCNECLVTVQTFSAISQLQTMHDDICRVALEQTATIVIVPFHKHFEIDGSIGLISRGMQNMNIKVMDKAPCSVGIFVDRGVLTGSLTILNNQSMYHVAVLYIGGPDDAESLCYGARMGRHPNVTLTIIRFLLFGCDNPRERKQDNHLIDEVRQANSGNQNFIYQEQVVKDGVALTASLRGLGNGFDLLILGRNHQASQVLMGLGAWSECPELGVVGDILASPDFGSTSSVLVIQQQRLIGEKFKSGMNKGVVAGTTTRETGNDASGDVRWEIAIDREKA